MVKEPLPCPNKPKMEKSSPNEKGGEEEVDLYYAGACYRESEGCTTKRKTGIML